MLPSKEANNLAALIVDRLGGRVETLKLQKLMYYCNGWSLAFRDEPMFSDRMEAWKHGPVIPSIYFKHSGQPSVESWDVGDADAITGEKRALAEHVIDLYGAKSGWALRQMTHNESPWVDAWARSGFGQRRGETIAQSAIKDYFASFVPKNGLIPKRAETTH